MNLLYICIMGYKNKEDQKAAARRFYLANTALAKERAVVFKAIAMKRNREYVDRYLKNHPCVDCKESDIIVLEFDHIGDQKIDAISVAIRNCWAISKLQAEIDKCEVRCANCHRRKTAKQFGWYKNRD